MTTSPTPVLIRTCGTCGSSVSAPDMESAIVAVRNYDLACCDGITPELTDLALCADCFEHAFDCEPDMEPGLIWAESTCHACGHDGIVFAEVD